MIILSQVYELENEFNEVNHLFFFCENFTFLKLGQGYLFKAKTLS